MWTGGGDGTAHSSVYKALAMLGIGRNAVVDVACLPAREAVDVTALEAALRTEDGRPCLVVANAGIWPAEELHREYYRRNPDQGYCRVVIAPKLAKFRQRYAHLLR